MSVSAGKVPKEFLKSNQNFDDYPLNLVERKRWGSLVLQSKSETLEDRQRNLILFVDEPKHQLPILEVSSDGHVSHKNLLSHAELVDRLQAELQQDPKDASLITNCQEDPPYRAL
jgi:hypothetical protein